MTVAERLEAVRAEISRAAERSGRDTGAVELVAVTKTVPVQKIRDAVDAGLYLFGENRVQEAQPKIEALEDVAHHVRWHLIGHLQSNKARAALDCFTVIQSVDTVGLAQRLNDIASRRGVPANVLLEVNVAGESSKFGFPPDALAAEMDALCQLSHLVIRGLMTVAPQTPDPDDVRWVFRALARVGDDLKRTYGLTTFTELSMGMSADFQVAIEEGATMVRIGSAIFGSREPNRESSKR